MLTSSLYFIVSAEVKILLSDFLPHLEFFFRSLSSVFERTQPRKKMFYSNFEAYGKHVFLHDCIFAMKIHKLSVHTRENIQVHTTRKIQHDRLLLLSLCWLFFCSSCYVVVVRFSCTSLTAIALLLFAQNIYKWTCSSCECVFVCELSLRWCVCVPSLLWSSLHYIFYLPRVHAKYNNNANKP